MGLQARKLGTYVAMVDSGAWTSCFPLSVASDIGILPGELTKSPTNAMGASAELEYWTTDVPIAGQVIAYVAPGVPSLWGPIITMTPCFISSATFLLGRADFFQALAVTFRGSQFELSY